MIKLLSDLCLDRNFSAIHPLSDFYSFDLCYSVISGDFDLNIRQSFTNLIITLWIDRNFCKIALPNGFRVWHNIESLNEMCKVDNQTKNYDKLRNFVLSYLKGQNEMEYKIVYDEERNQMTKAVLELLKKMLEFGFYKRPDELFDITEQLLNHLNSVFDVTS
jgi:hypothetical protein